MSTWDDCNWVYPQYRPYETALGSSKITVVLACLNGKKFMNGMVACGMILTTDWAYKNLHKVDDEVAHGARRDQSPFSNGFKAWCFSTHLTNMLGETMWNHCNQWNWFYGMAKDNVANHPIFTHPAAILLMNKLLGSLNNELWYEVPTYLPMCRILSMCHFREL